MYGRLLVPLSNLGAAGSAVQTGVALARQTGASLELAWVGASSGRTVREMAERLSADAGITIGTAFPDPPFWPALEELIRTHRIDLVIVTANERTARRSPLSSRVQAVVGAASVPVLFVPGTVRSWREAPAPLFHRIVISLDGSALAEAVIPFAMSLLGAEQGDVTLLTVAPLGRESRGGHADAADPAYLEQVAQRLRAGGATTHTHVARDPHAAGGIVLYAYMNNADLIAMSTHGRGALSRLVLGSVAERVMHLSTLPVLLWRPVQPAVPADDPSHETARA